ncbi:cell wall-binding repeat-containing protein [Peptacetobacter hominis]|nr:cell wall-binding repeat-containing protein [Peptacetobacter hominis]
MKKKIFASVAIAILVIISYFSGDVINHFYLNNYNKSSIVGIDRFDTIIKSGESQWKNSTEAILMNTSNIEDAISLSSYAINNNEPILLTRDTELSEYTYKFLKNSKIKKVYIYGGIHEIPRNIERIIERIGIETERIYNDYNDNASIDIAEKMIKKHKKREVFFVYNSVDGYSDAMSVLPASVKYNIPIIFTDETGYSKASDFVRENSIEKIYLIGDENKFGDTFEKLYMDLNVERIVTKDKFELNRVINKKFFDIDNADTAYIVKAGNISKEGYTISSDFINGIAIMPKFATGNNILVLNDEGYLQKEAKNMIDEYGIKNLCSVGFKLEKRELIILTEEQRGIISGIVLSAMLVFMLIRGISAGQV